MGVGRTISGWVNQERASALRQRLHEVAEQSAERHLRLAVTGLSQSGKTVFITALVHHLLQAHRTAALPFFAAAAEGRIIGSRNLSDQLAQPFPLHQALAGLTREPPLWPASTEDLSVVRLAIRYRRPAGLRRLLGEIGTLHLDIIDYPGEWLLDLPLLELTYDQWSQQQTGLFAGEPRASLAADWLGRLRGIDWTGPVDEARLAELAAQFTALLQQLRADPHALSLLQPGRLVLPGDLAGDSRLAFFPLVGVRAPAAGWPAGSGGQMLEQRYQSYCQEVVKPFYRRHFCRFDRQIVLVDCLKTLNRGQACFDDMKTALTTVLQSFNYGRSGFLRRVFSPRIDRVLFASTKADQVTANQHHNLDRFLELIIQDAQREIRFEGIDTRCLALASVRSTQAAEARVDGQSLSCLRGRRKSDGEEVALFPGEVPTELPRPEDWNQERFRFVDFAPRRLALNDPGVSDHVRLDQVLEYMMGDQFR